MERISRGISKGILNNIVLYLFTSVLFFICTTYSATAVPLNMSLLTTYQDNAAPGSINGARGMQIDTDRRIAFISATTADSLTAINFSDPLSLSVHGSVTDTIPPGSIDGIWFGTLDYINGIFYAPSATDDMTSWYNVSASPFVLLNDTAADIAGAGSQEEQRDVVIVDNAGTRWLITGGRTDDTVSSFNVTNPMIRPVVVNSFYDAAGVCSVNGVHDLYNIPGTSYVLAAATVNDYITVLNVSAAGGIACIGSGYTSSSGAGSVDGLQYMYFDNVSNIIYTTSPTDGYFTIINATNYATGSLTVVGSIGGLTTPVSVAVSSTFDGTKYAFVGSSTAGRGITIINITNPAAPTIVEVFNQTSGTCIYNGVYSLDVVGNYLFATSGVDYCFYSIALIDGILMNVTLLDPSDNYINDTDQFVNLTFNATVTDADGIASCSLWTNYSGTWSLNQTQIVGGTSNVTSFNLTDLTNKTFIWNIECVDIFSHHTFDPVARTVILNWSDTSPNVLLSSPIEDYTNSAQQFVNLTFNATVSDDKGLVNCSLWTNYSGTWSLNQTQSIGGTSNVTSFNLTDLTNKTFVWNIQCFDSASQSEFATLNRTVTLNWNPLVDTPPSVSLYAPSAEYTNSTSQFVNMTFIAVVTDDFNLVNCSLWTNYSGTWSLNQTQIVGGTSNVTSFDLTDLTNNTFVWNIECYDNSSQAAFGSTNRTVILNWVPPLEGNFSIQKYDISLGSGVTSGFAPFTGGQTDFNIVPFVTMRISSTSPNWNYFLPDVYFNSTGVIVTRTGGTNTVMDLIVTAVQFDPNSVKVQNGTFSLVSGSNTSTINSAVDLSRSALIFYYTSTAGNTLYNSNSIMGNISAVNQLNFSVVGTLGTKSGHWYVFESLDEGFSVQRANLVFASNTVSTTGAISFVTTAKTFLIASYITSETADDPRDGSLYVELTDSTTITGTRLGVPAATLNANVYAITFSGNENVRRGYFSYATGTGTASANPTNFNLDKSMAWNPVLTSRMADISTATAIESSFQLLNLTSSTTIVGSRSETVGDAGGTWEIIDWIPLHAPIIDSMSIDDDSPPAAEIILSAGSTRSVNCTVIASDFEGADIIINASATFYYYLNKSSDSDDNIVHYTNDSCSVVSSDDTSKTFLCAFEVYYYANNGTWNCNATVYNVYSYLANNETSAVIDPLYAVNLTDGIDFGDVSAGFPSDNLTVNITNIGNMPVNVTLQGYALVIGDNTGMNCSDSTNITITNIRVSTNSTANFTQKLPLNGSIQSLNFKINKQINGTPVFNTTYWQISPDPGYFSRICTGYVIFNAEAS
ncbi:MAG: hypothetical protein ACP5OA_01035 [Candidatus Woesearchaeota archaeon]